MYKSNKKRKINKKAYVHEYVKEFEVYAFGECEHTENYRHYNSGKITCEQCGATYNEALLEWEY